MSVADDLVPVMVPKSLLTDVYALLGKGSAHASVDEGGGDELWNEDELEAIAVDSRPSFTRVSALLDALAPIAPRALSYSEAAKAAGLTTGELHGALSGFSRSMKKQYGDSYWPMDSTWGESAVAGQQGEAHYSLNTRTAELWSAIRSKQK